MIPVNTVSIVAIICCFIGCICGYYIITRVLSNITKKYYLYYIKIDI